jgi:hypothetical protein
MRLPSIRACIKVFGPTERWKGNCHGVASALVEKKLVKGSAVYGHWLGPIAENSFFAPRRGYPFVQHGWVLMPDESIVDPTRWVFEAVDPYIFHGENGGLYDEGGNDFRMQMIGMPRYDPNDKLFQIPKRVMDTKTWAFVEEILEIDSQGDQKPGTLSRNQLYWLANLAPSILGEHQAGVYGAIKKLDRLALIPIDNYRAYERKQAK